MEDGVEVCNACVRPASSPYRYSTAQGERGCVARCHDAHIRRNTKPGWMSPRYVLPKWVTEARRQITTLHERLL